MRARTVIVGFGIAALLVGGTGAAQADIQWKKSIDGVKLGWGRGKVLEAKGEPRAKHKAHITRVGKGRKWEYGRDGRRLTVFFHRGDVVRLSTRSPSQRTPEDWGPGTPLSVVRQADPKLVKDFCSDVKFSRGRWCGSSIAPDPWERSWEFWVRKGVITSFTVYVVAF